MNIFILDSNIIKSAEYHNDFHVRKQVVEYAQILATIKRKHTGKLESVYRIKYDSEKVKMHKFKLYVLPEDKFIYRFGLKIMDKPKIPVNVYEYHPCVLWAQKSSANYQYLYKLFIALSNEYFYRFQKFNGASNYAAYLSKSPTFFQHHLTDFVQVVNDGCKNKNPIIAYRSYYLKNKRHLATWRNRSIPHWYK